MRKRLVLIFLISVSLTYAVHEGYAQEKADSPTDIVVVLDNSNIMKTNDPEFLAKEAVLDFVDILSGNSRISFILFSDKPDLVMPLTVIAGMEADEKITKALDKVDYTGERANIAAAIESAIALLKKDGRANAKKVIILMADGAIETGNRAKDIGESILLKDIHATESKKAGIRIFGIAFTDEAHLEPIRVLCRNTDGDHYRASKAEDVHVALNSINKAISRIGSESEPRPPVDVRATTEEKGAFPVKLLLLVFSGLLVGILAGIFAVVYMKSKKGESKVTEAYLLDMKNATDKKTHKLSKRLITIGRTRGSGVDICIAKNTISTTHAQIEYKNRNFYLTDLRSRNGTYLNGAKERITSEVCLKDGDVIAFDQYSFKFVVPDQAKPSGMRSDRGSHGRTILRIPE